MCVIAYVPAGKQIKDETITAMFRNNPDGAGIMWKPLDGSKIQIRKGFMNGYELIEAYKQIPVDCEKAIHCRIATSGKISVGCCHPFPVVSKLKDMKNATDETDIALMHNGVIGFCTPKEGMNAKHSDTMKFAQQYLLPLKEQLDFPPIKNLISESTNSRLLIFRQDAKTLMFGDWKKEDGIYFSNLYHKFDVNRKQAPKSYGYIDDCNNGWDYCTPISESVVSTSLIGIEVKDVKTPDELALIEDRIWVDLDDLGYQIYDIYSEEYNHSFYVYVEIYGDKPQELSKIAGYDVVECY